MINLYSKIASLRHSIIGANLKKSGFNSFTKFNYFELADFMNHVAKFEQDLKILSKFDVKGTNAVLTVFDIESDQFTTFEAPFEKSSNISDGPQAIGAGITYLKRYLYLNYLNLTEADTLDATFKSEPKPAVKVAAPKPVEFEPAFDDDEPNYDNRPAVNTISIIDGVKMIVRERRSDGQRFWTAYDTNVKKTVHIG